MKVISSDDAGPKIAPEPITSGFTMNNEYDTVVGKFILRQSPNELGYYKKQKDLELRQLTNFIVKLNRQVSTSIDEKPETYFTGTIEIEEYEPVRINKLFGKDLASPQSLATYLTNLAGTRISFFGSQNDISEAIKIFNRDIDIFVAEEFGYSSDLTSYKSSNITITADSITESETMIKYDSVGKRNKLMFANSTVEELNEIKSGLIEDYIPWDDTVRTISALSFTFLPVIFPRLEKIVDKKPYLMLKGPTGCGKTLSCELLQQFYGDVKSLVPWNSTSTAINVAGTSFKDAVFMVDDFKKTNFNTEYKMNDVMATLQNYADQTSKLRSNTSLTIRDEKYIKGFLMISAEDLVVSEASTIARGIIIEMENKDPNFKGEAKLRKLSKKFKKLTPHFIKFIMSIKDDLLIKRYSYSKNFFEEIVQNKSLDGNNIPRLINNFALLKTAWYCLGAFLFAEKGSKMLEDFNALYDNDLTQLFLKNYDRVQLQNPEVKFEETLWDLIENNSAVLTNIGINDGEDLKRVGYYEINKVDDKSKIKIALNMNKAYKLINSYLREEGGIGNAKETIISKLIYSGKIRVIPSGRVSFRDSKTVRGVEWIGDFPKQFFGINEETIVEDSSFTGNSVPLDRFDTLDDNDIVNNIMDDFDLF